MSRSNRKLVKAIDSETAKYFNENGEEPDEEYLANTLSEDIEKVRNAKNVSMIASTLPINEQISIVSGNETEDIIEKENLIEHVQSILEEFNDREQLIIQLYYFEELNLKEISAVLNISESRISQIHKKLLLRIRERLGK